MTNSLIAKAAIEINANKATVWKALIEPEMIKQYLFGTEVECDWKVGSPIRWRGVWEGKRYEDKGTVLENIPEKKLKTNYWSSMSGSADIPENYVTVTYELEEKGSSTVLTIIQDGIKTEEAKKHMEENWMCVLGGIKKLLEK